MNGKGNSKVRGVKRGNPERGEMGLGPLPFSYEIEA